MTLTVVDHAAAQVVLHHPFRSIKSRSDAAASVGLDVSGETVLRRTRDGDINNFANYFRLSARMHRLQVRRAPYELPFLSAKTFKQDRYGPANHALVELCLLREQCVLKLM